MVAKGSRVSYGRLENPGNAIWAAVLDGRIVGFIAIDGEDLGGDVAPFAVVDHRRRRARRLLGPKDAIAALDHVDARGFSKTHYGPYPAFRQPLATPGDITRIAGAIGNLEQIHRIAQTQAKAPPISQPF